MSAVFGPEAVLRVLARHQVRSVVIGGVAANALGSPLPTEDVDVCYDRSDDNMERLAAALREMAARLRGAPEDLPFILDALTLRRGDTFTFETTYGPVDILGTPAGTRGYDELASNAVEFEVREDLSVLVCCLDDLIRMKTAAGRPKDLRALEELGALRDEIEDHPPGDDAHLHGPGRRAPRPPGT